MTTLSQNDRVSYSYGFKVPGEQQYSSINVSVSVSTDVRPGETPEAAMERAKAFVLAQADMPPPALAPADPPPRHQARVDDEKFDPNNPVHYRLAQAVFDAEKIKSDKSREYKLYNLLPGERVGDIGRIVREDVAAFRIGRRDGSKSDWNGQWPRRG